MRCSRCGASAVVTRGQEYFCGRCALAYDWEEIIAIAQEATGAPPRRRRPLARHAPPPPSWTWVPDRRVSP